MAKIKDTELDRLSNILDKIKERNEDVLLQLKNTQAKIKLLEKEFDNMSEQYRIEFNNLAKSKNHDDISSSLAENKLIKEKLTNNGMKLKELKIKEHNLYEAYVQNQTRYDEVDKEFFRKLYTLLEKRKKSKTSS